MRVEQTNVRAHGPLTDLTRNVRRDAAGRPLLDAAGRPIANRQRPPRSAATFLPRGTDVRKEYLRLFPEPQRELQPPREPHRPRRSVHFGWTARLQSVRRRRLAPNTDNPPAANNRIGVNNVGIKPWSATSTKVRLE